MGFLFPRNFTILTEQGDTENLHLQSTLEFLVLLQNSSSRVQTEGLTSQMGKAVL